LTSPGGTAYGAAVLTATGNVYQAGQYSSFSHVTNVHAEQVALVLATMADDPDVLALAVASTGAPGPIEKREPVPIVRGEPPEGCSVLRILRLRISKTVSFAVSFLVFARFRLAVRLC